MTQNQALDILKTGANVFLTGEPGAGKTFTVNSFVSYLREFNIEPSITASTGIAATHIGGMTIHAWSGIGIRRFLTKYDLDKIASNETVVKRIRRTTTLIIDEVSMLSPNLLTMVDMVCREVKGRSDAFGGIQIVLVGDFFQLPPINRPSEELNAMKKDLFDMDIDDDNEKKLATFAYESPAWKSARFITCYLTEQHRQDDEDFLNILSAIRRNEFEQGHLEILESRLIDEEKDLTDIPHLYSHNENVDRMNEEKLRQISDKETVYSMSTYGAPHMVASLQKGCLSPQQLVLKKGAKVMFTKNNRELGFVNGTLGEVLEAPPYGSPKIALQNGEVLYVSPMDWTIEENGSVRAKISQIPLRLAWAITVHKSQGMSLDEAVMDLRQVFEYGQGYVALSRVRRLSGLHLRGWNTMVFQVHPEILESDIGMRQASVDAEMAFNNMNKDELAEMHANFIRASGGGKEREPKTSDKKTRIKKTKAQTAEGGDPSTGSGQERLAKLREKYPNAYRPWKEGDNEVLTKRFNEKATMKELSQEFGRQVGGIRARLIMLELIEDDYHKNDAPK